MYSQEALIDKIDSAYKDILVAQGDVQKVRAWISDIRLAELDRLLQEARELADEIGAVMVEDLEREIGREEDAEFYPQ